jgi:hypothetical protein
MEVAPGWTEVDELDAPTLLFAEQDGPEYHPQEPLGWASGARFSGSKRLRSWRRGSSAVAATHHPKPSSRRTTV